jgi:hypothetical protein
MTAADQHDPFAGAGDLVEVQVDEVPLEAGGPGDDRVAEYVARLGTMY